MAYGLGDNSKILFIFDFGLAKKLPESEGKGKKGHHSPKNAQFCGTIRYGASNSHFGLPSSYKDDLESLFYTIVDLFKRDLPWTKYEKDTAITDKSDLCAIVGLAKNSIKSSTLFSGMPEEFTVIFDYIRIL